MMPAIKTYSAEELQDLSREFERLHGEYWTQQRHMLVSLEEQTIRYPEATAAGLARGGMSYDVMKLRYASKLLEDIDDIKYRLAQLKEAEKMIGELFRVMEKIKPPVAQS